MGRNFNGTLIIKRRAERRSDAGMIILMDLGRDQIGFREGEAQFYECEWEGSSLFWLSRAERQSYDLKARYRLEAEFG
jgi:hypothetical protein